MPVSGTEQRRCMRGCIKERSAGNQLATRCGLAVRGALSRETPRHSRFPASSKSFAGFAVSNELPNERSNMAIKPTAALAAATLVGLVGIGGAQLASAQETTTTDDSVVTDDSTTDDSTTTSEENPNCPNAGSDLSDGASSDGTSSDGTSTGVGFHGGLGRGADVRTVAYAL